MKQEENIQRMDNKEKQPADPLNAMASGGGQNEYIWIKWTK